VAEPIIWKEITTAFEGRAIGGSWAVEEGCVRVKTALGEKSAPLEEADGVWSAWRLPSDLRLSADTRLRRCYGPSSALLPGAEEVMAYTQPACM
jgi:hypothetical protein